MLVAWAAQLGSNILATWKRTFLYWQPIEPASDGALYITVFSVGIVEIDRLQTERSSTGPKMELYFNESKAYRALYVLCHLHLYKFTVHY